MRLTSQNGYGLRMASAPGRAFSTAALADKIGLLRQHLAGITPRPTLAGCVEIRRAGWGAILTPSARKGGPKSAEVAFHADLDRSTLADIALVPVEAEWAMRETP